MANSVSRKTPSPALAQFGCLVDGSVREVSGGYVREDDYCFLPVRTGQASEKASRDFLRFV
jgi:hypothetical protein